MTLRRLSPASLIAALSLLGIAIVVGCGSSDGRRAIVHRDEPAQVAPTQKNGGELQQAAQLVDPALMAQVEARRAGNTDIGFNNLGNSKSRRLDLAHDRRDYPDFPAPKLSLSADGDLIVPDSEEDDDADSRQRAQKGKLVAKCPAFVPGDELWIIEVPTYSGGPSAADDDPGTGSMMARRPGVEDVPIPLRHTDVSAKVSGYIASVAVEQTFHNPYTEKIEAVYVFPLPQNSAVGDFVMTIGDRRIRGIIRKRAEAVAIYNQARSQGHVASLLTQERPNIFTQSVANIEPGKQIDIHIEYFNTLAYVDGWYTFVFPMVVGPRFNPAGTTDGVGATPWPNGRSNQSTSIPYLKPEQRSGHDIGLTVDVEAGVSIEGLECPTHAVEVTERKDTSARITLRDSDSVPNRDFVLRYRVQGKKLKSAVVTHSDDNGGFFTLMMYPPGDGAQLPRQPLEMIFVLDCSGSMGGWPMAKAKKAAARALRHLNRDDTFQIIRFSSEASSLGPAPVIATARNVERGLEYLESLHGSGGTHMLRGIQEALGFAHDPERLRVVSFLTDGFIGNEKKIFQEVDSSLGESRIFSFGVGKSVNRYLLEGLARIGRGAVAYVGADEGAGRAVDLFYERLRHPVVTDITVHASGVKIADLLPGRIPDLFLGRPIVLTGRLEGKRGTIEIRGRRGGEDFVLSHRVDTTSGSEHAGLPNIWARTRIAGLSDAVFREAGEDPSAAICDVALEFGILSQFTAFIAVDSASKTEGNHGMTVRVPVPVPDGVRYETTVPGGGH